MTMDVRRAQKSQTGADKASRAKGVSASRWLSNLKEEFRKISWTSKDELKIYTKVVVAATFIMGLGIYLVDLLCQGTLAGISSLIRSVIS